MNPQEVNSHLLKKNPFSPLKVIHQGTCISIHRQICSTKAQSEFPDHGRITVRKGCRGSKMKGAEEAACKGDIRGCFYSLRRLMRRERQREKERALSSIFLFKHPELPMQTFTQPCTSKDPILHSPKVVIWLIFSPCLQ